MDTPQPALRMSPMNPPLPTHPVPSRRRLRGAFAALALASITSAHAAAAEVFISEALRDGELPPGWSQTGIDFRTAAGGYALFETAGSILTTAQFDAAAADEVLVALSVAKFGQGDYGPITVEYSLNGGEDWDFAGDSSTPTTSDYIDDQIRISDTSSEMVVRFTRAGSPSQKRFRDVVISEVGPFDVVALSPASGEVDVPVDTQLTLTFNRFPSAGSGSVILRQAPSVTEVFPASAGVIDGNTVTFTPSEPLNELENYFVLVENDAFEDAEGESFAGFLIGTEWAFVAAGPDMTPPTPVASSPESGATNITTNLFETAFTVTFDKPVELGSDGFLGGDPVEIRRVADDEVVESLPVGGDLSAASVDGDELILLPFEVLDFDTDYYVFVPEGTVKDLLGNESEAFGGPESDFPWIFSTLPAPEPPPVLDGVSDYTQDFATFSSAATLPTGWSVTDGADSDYGGDWDTGFSAGTRGNASVLGFQHTSGTGTAIKTVTIQNTSGETITDLLVSYDGRVARDGEGRNPVYSVDVNGISVPALGYDTLEGDFVTKSAVVSGLNIEDGGFFEISWSSTRGGGSGASKQIGISNLMVSLDLPEEIAPSVAAVEILDPITQTGFGVLSGVTGEGSDPVTGVGFVISETAVQPEPVIGDPETTVIELFDDFEFMLDLVIFDFEGLAPGVSYSVRFFATSDAGTTYSAVTTQSTVSGPASLSAAGYDEDFLGFTGVPSLPQGWSATADVTNYVGDWGSGTAGGFRGPAAEDTVGVIGYQHTSGTGTLTISLEMTNDTGAEITALDVSYLGRVAQTGRNRFPVWTFALDGVEVPALSYSTEEGEDKEVSSVIAGLSIPEGAVFTLTWSSDRGEGGGASRQIGLADVSVESVTLDVLPPVIDLADGTYFEDQTVFVVNFGGYDPSVEIRYTLDGTNPGVGTGLLYDDATGIAVDDGNGPVELRAVAVDTDTSLPSPTVVANYMFPLNVADIAALRAQPTGSTLYRVDNTMVLTAQTSFRNTKFLQDDSGFGIQIDDPGAVIETVYETGDAIGALVGKLSAFQGQLQFSPEIDPGPAVSSGNAVAPASRTLATLTSDDQSVLVVIEDVAFQNADGTATFGGGGSETPIGDPSVAGFDGIYRNVFGESDITGSLLPTGTGSVTGIIQERNVGLTISARGLADLDFADGPPAGDFAAWIAGFDVGGMTGPFDAPAGDGVPNILKHVLGLAPNVAVAGPLVTISEAGPSSLTFTHTRIKPDQLAGDAIRDYEWSTDLAAWASGGEEAGGIIVEFSQETVLDDSHPDFDLVEVTATVTEGAAGRLFVRIAADIDAGGE